MFPNKGRRPIDGSCYVVSGNSDVSVNIALLFWPIEFLDFDGGEQRIVTPIAPRLNCRDVTDARLRDPLVKKLINGEECHVMFGSICTEEAQPPDGIRLSMSSVFDMYEDVKGKFFTSHISVPELQKKLQEFLGNIKWSNKRFPDTNDKVFTSWLAKRKKWFAATQDASSLLIGFMEVLKFVFNEFRSVSNYLYLRKVLKKGASATPDLPAYLKNAAIPLRATYEFQQYMHPVCLTIMKGNHRHARMFYSIFGLERVPSQRVVAGNNSSCSEMMTRVELVGTGGTTELHWVQENNRNGYLIGTTATSTSSSTEQPIHMKYSIISIQCSNPRELSMEQLLYVSTTENEKPQKSVSKEVCHDILSKCYEVLSLSKSSSSDNEGEEVSQPICSSHMKNQMRSYLQATESQLHNNSRNSDSPLNQMRSQKKKLRKIMLDVFLHGAETISKYSQGRTYCEFSKKQLKAIFKEHDQADPWIENLKETKMYGFFILLDTIFIVDEICSFIKMIRSCYKPLHVSASMSHNINHTQLWDSGHVVASMNDFVVVMIRIMKNPGTLQVLVDDVGESFREVCIELVEHEDDDTAQKEAVENRKNKIEKFHQKLSHVCSQYAFFVALTVANMLGFYPDLPGCTWKIPNGKANDEVCHYNIFSLLLFLLSLPGNSDDDEVPPKTMFIRIVVSDFITKLYHDATRSMGPSEHVFPLTYGEFCDQGCSFKVIQFFKDCVVQHNHSIREFFSELSQEDEKKREATKRKAMNSHKKKNARRKSEGETNGTDDGDEASTGDNHSGGNVRGADEVANQDSTRAQSPTSVIDQFPGAPGVEQKTSDNLGEPGVEQKNSYDRGFIQGEVAPNVSASTQLIVHGLGRDALGLMNDTNCIIGQSMKTIVESLVNNSNNSIPGDAVKAINDFSATSSHELYGFLSQVINKFWTKVAIKENTTCDDCSNTKDLPFIKIPCVAMTRDLNAAMKYFSCTEWKNVTFTPHSDYFLVSAPRQQPNGTPSPVPVVIAGVEAVQIASSASNNSIFGKLESFIVHVGE